MAGLLLLPATVHAAGSEGIAVVVNSDAITNSDVSERMKMIAISSGMPQTPEMMAKLRPQIIDMLIDESIQMQEARRLKVKVSKEEIDNGYAEIAKNNNIPVDKFRGMIKQSGISTKTMDQQIRAQLAWGKVVQGKVRSRIEVSDSDIDTELEKLKTKIGETQYHVAQIYVPVSDPKNDSKAQAFVNKLVSELRANPDAFAKAAQQVSQGQNAKRGGDMGWIEKGQLPAEVDAALDALQVGQISDPIKSQNSYYIVQMKEKRTMTEDLLPKREDILQRVGTQRLERGARRYMMDLRSTAFIENRA